MSDPRATLLENVLATIRQHRMIVPGDRVAVACSGGPDSTALLLILRELASELGCTLSVAHVNHQLRGQESNDDERFVRGLAGRLDLPFQGTSQDVQLYARETRRNLEQAAREVRHRFFGGLIEAGDATRVAVGHTADDQAETLLHRLLRGAGPRGLAGIHPVVKGIIVRPLLGVRRQALRQWLIAEQQPWREDSSNLDLRRMRNRIRWQLLPLLEELNPGVVEVLAGAADIAREEEIFWQAYLQPLLPKLCREDKNELRIEASVLRDLPTAVARRVLRYTLSRAAELLPNQGEAQLEERRAIPAETLSSAAEFGQIQHLLHLVLEGQSGSSLTLPRKIRARKEFHQVILSREDLMPSPQGFCYAVQTPGVIAVPEINSLFFFEFVPVTEDEARYNKEGDILDPKLAAAPLVLRSWRAGDAFQPRGHWRATKFKELFLRQRVSIRERRQWPVLVAQGRIVWARKMGVAEGCSPPPESKEGFRIRETSGTD